MVNAMLGAAAVKSAPPPWRPARLPPTDGMSLWGSVGPSSAFARRLKLTRSVRTCAWQDARREQAVAWSDDGRHDDDPA